MCLFPLKVLKWFKKKYNLVLFSKNVLLEDGIYIFIYRMHITIIIIFLFQKGMECMSSVQVGFVPYITVFIRNNETV